MRCARSPWRDPCFRSQRVLTSSGRENPLTRKPPTTLVICIGPMEASPNFLRLRSFDLDFLLRLDSLGLFRKRDREHALLKARLDLVGVDAFRHCELALERAEVAFTEIVILLLLLLLFFLFALDHQVAVGEPNLDVLFVHTRKLGRDLIGVILFSDVDGRSGAPCQLTSPEGLDVKNRAAEGGVPCAATEILEQLVDFAAEALKGPPRLQGSWTLGSLCLRFYWYFACSFGHFQVRPLT